MLILVFTIYILTILLAWHEKRWSVFAPNERPQIYGQGYAFIAHLLRFGLFYISIAGIFFYLDVLWAIIAWITGLAISTLCQKYYFQKRLAELIQTNIECTRQEQCEAKKHDVVISDEEALNVAETVAYESLLTALYDLNNISYATPEIRNKIENKAKQLMARNMLRR